MIIIVIKTLICIIQNLCEMDKFGPNKYSQLQIVSFFGKIWLNVTEHSRGWAGISGRFSVSQSFSGELGPQSFFAHSKQGGSSRESIAPTGRVLSSFLSDLDIGKQKKAKKDTLCHVESEVKTEQKKGLRSHRLNARTRRNDPAKIRITIRKQKYEIMRRAQARSLNPQ